MKQKISQFVSFIFHPMFMPLVGMVLILYTGSYLSLIAFEGKRAILLITALSTVLLPVSVLPFLYYQRIITNYTIPKRKERLIPFLLSIVFYYFGYYILHKYSAPLLIQHFLLASLICLVLTVIIHIKWKISIHMIGIGGIIGLLSTFSFLYQQNIYLVLVLAILLAGIIGTARLHLRLHTQAQIYGGFVLGYVLTFGVIVFMNV